MTKKISGAEYPLAKIFSSDFDYTIPSYQRPYAWTVDEASELFDDLYDFHRKEHEETYFLGSIVLIKEDGKPYAEVIDGQQRLTTLTILVAAIADKLPDEQKSQFVKYIKEPGNEFEGLAPKSRLTLRERDRDFFEKYVQALRFDELFAFDKATLDTEAKLNIQQNSRLIADRIEDKLSSVSELREFASFLVQRCYIVAVCTPTQQSAFRVFSVLNDRGLDLLPTDIIKADIIGRISQDRQDEFTERWEELEVQTGREGFNDLFGHIRMIYAKTKAKRALLEEFKEHVLTLNKSPEYLIEKILEPYADAYLIVKNKNYVSTRNAERVNRLLAWLHRTYNSDWVPPATLFLSQNTGNSEYTLWFFEKLERLSAFLHICGKNINQRIERYAAVINGLWRDHSVGSKIREIELTADEKQEMKSVLNGKIYDLTARRRNYVILRLDSFMSDGAATYDSSILTIEHVLPQTVNGDSEWARTWPAEDLRKQWVHRIANLVPLNRRRNSKAHNFDFKKKKEAYFVGRQGVSSYVTTTQVLNEEQWTPEVVKRRQAQLLDVLYENWELESE